MDQCICLVSPHTTTHEAPSMAELSIQKSLQPLKRNQGSPFRPALVHMIPLRSKFPLALEKGQILAQSLSHVQTLTVLPGSTRRSFWIFYPSSCLLVNFNFIALVLARLAVAGRAASLKACQNLNQQFHGGLAYSSAWNPNSSGEGLSQKGRMHVKQTLGVAALGNLPIVVVSIFFSIMPI